jgi:cation:H+ antiporter
MLGLEAFSLSVNLVIFGISAIIVWIAGTRLAIYADELAERLNLARAFMGLVFLATTTELPEIVTTITAAQANNADLVLGNMFGGITMQTAILAIADFFVVRHALTSWPRKPTHALEAVILVILLSMLLAVTLVGDFALTMGVGIGAFCLSAAYPLVIVLLQRYDKRPLGLPSICLTNVIASFTKMFECQVSQHLHGSV